MAQHNHPDERSWTDWSVAKVILNVFLSCLARVYPFSRFWLPLGAFPVSSSMSADEQCRAKDSCFHSIRCSSSPSNSPLPVVTGIIKKTPVLVKDCKAQSLATTQRTANNDTEGSERKKFATFHFRRTVANVDLLEINLSGIVFLRLAGAWRLPSLAVCEGEANREGTHSCALRSRRMARCKEVEQDEQVIYLDSYQSRFASRYECLLTIVFHKTGPVGCND